MRQYILSLIITTLICSLITGIADQFTGKGWIRLLCGLMITLSLLAPLNKIETVSLPDSFADFRTDGKQLAGRGEEMAWSNKSAIIKQQLEAYILDKASGICEDVSAEVRLDDAFILTEVILSGSFSAYEKQQIEKILLPDLGITEEKLIWNS